MCRLVRVPVCRRQHQKNRALTCRRRRPPSTTRAPSTCLLVRRPVVAFVADVCRSPFYVSIFGGSSREPALICGRRSRSVSLEFCISTVVGKDRLEPVHACLSSSSLLPPCYFPGNFIEAGAGDRFPGAWQTIPVVDPGSRGTEHRKEPAKGRLLRRRCRRTRPLT